MSRPSVAEVEPRPKYPQLPASVLTDPPGTLIHSGKVGTAFVDDIIAITEKVDEVRMALSRSLDRWNRIRTMARLENDEPIFERASAEIDGLHALVARLSRL